MIIDSLIRWWWERNRKPTGFDPEAHNRYAPNPVQREFIRLCAEQHWYLAFGDTDHTKPQIKAFALNPETVGALEQAGKKQYFLESGPENQYYFDFIRRDEEQKRRKESVIYLQMEKLKEGYESFGGIWLEPEDSPKVADVFEASARQVDSLRFIAADHRLPDPDIGADIMKRLDSSYMREKAWKLFREKYPRLSGSAGGWRDRLAQKFINHPVAKIDYKAITDDTDTAAGVASHGGPGALLFGGHHFNPAANPDNDAYLGALLKGTGKSLCVLEVFEDAAHRAEQMPGQGNRRSDAELYVTPPANRPSGIRINNPALLPLFRQAVVNAQAGRIPQFRTAQPLPS